MSYAASPGAATASPISVVSPPQVPVDADRVEALIEETFGEDAVAHARDRRTRNRLRTRSAILKAAWRLFLTKGFDDTTINDITESADIGKGTFFAHFARKTDVALHPCHKRIGTVLESCRAGRFDGFSAVEQVRAIMSTVARLDGHTYPEARLMTSITLQQFFAEPSLMQEEPPEFERLLAEVLKAGIESGEVDPSLDIEATASLLNAGLYSAKAAWLRPGPMVVPFDLPERVDENTRVILRGIVRT